MLNHLYALLSNISDNWFSRDVAIRRVTEWDSRCIRDLLSLSLSLSLSLCVFSTDIEHRVIFYSIRDPITFRHVYYVMITSLLTCIKTIIVH